MHVSGEQSVLMQYCCRTILLILASSYAFLTQAGVFKCQKEDGLVEFQDKPCHQSIKDPQFLPYIYQMSSNKVINLQEKALQATQKKNNKAAKQRIHKNKLSKKQMEKEMKSQKKQLANCLKTQEKIKITENKLRRGVKLRTLERLKAELKHYENMKQRYCISTR